METEWYLPDHLFRQGSTGRAMYSAQAVAVEMSSTYLRYRNVPPQSLETMQLPAAERLATLGITDWVVLAGERKEFRLVSRLERLRCENCFYVSYLSAAEPRNCLRCGFGELHDFPKKK